MLETMERTGLSHLSWRQDELGQRLGVGRTLANRVISRLQSAGLVKVQRGGLDIVDAAGLSQEACECHAKIRGFYDSLLGEIRT
jgi:Mn-dependent DtxR family transcriptional regulator